VTDPVSRANVERLFKTNPETAHLDDPFLKAMAEKGHTPEFQKFMSDNMMALAYGISPFSLTDEISHNIIPKKR